MITLIDDFINHIILPLINGWEKKTLLFDNFSYEYLFL